MIVKREEEIQRKKTENGIPEILPKLGRRYDIRVTVGKVCLESVQLAGVGDPTDCDTGFLGLVHGSGNGSLVQNIANIIGIRVRNHQFDREKAVRIQLGIGKLKNILYRSLISLVTYGDIFRFAATPADGKETSEKALCSLII